MVRQADKLERKIAQLGERDGGAAPDVADRVLDLALARWPDPPAPVYVTGLGSSGSHWLGLMLAELPGFADAEEVYFPPALVDELTDLEPDEQRFVVDAVHLLHAWPYDADLRDETIVNSAAGSQKVRLYKAWDPDATVVYLHRDPRDQVVSATFRKDEYRQYDDPEASDLDYLRSRCERNRADHSRYRRLPQRADHECAYESLRDDPVGHLRTIAALACRPASETELCEAARRHDAELIRAGRAERKGNLDLGGRAVGWRRALTVPQRRLAHAELAGVVDALGYALGDCVDAGEDLPVPAVPRMLRFPDHGVGTLWLRSADGAWTSGMAAAGRVEVPAGHLALLRPRPKALADPSWLPEAGELDGLCLARRRRVDDVVRRAMEVPSLRCLDLSASDVAADLEAEVAARPTIRCLGLARHGPDAKAAS